MATYTIGALIKRFKLSRSTLLYYDKIGLLTPSARSDAGYRLYTDNDLKRMEQIALYKEAGLALEAIAQLLGGEPAAQTFITIIRYVLPSEDHTIQKLLLLYLVSAQC